MIRVTEVRVLERFCVRLTFSDGTEKDLDLSPYLRGPVFETLREQGRFAELAVDSELGTIVWPNGADICPDVLYHGRSPAVLEESQK